MLISSQNTIHEEESEYVYTQQNEKLTSLPDLEIGMDVFIKSVMLI